MARFGGFGMNEEDEAFEELSRKQGYWGLQGSRKHQIMRYAENVESKENITQDEIIEMAAEIWNAGSSFPIPSSDDILHFAKLVAAKEREACAKLCESLPMQQEIDVRDQCAAAIRARGQA